MYSGRNKYGNKKVSLDGQTFDSRKEAKYYLYLRSLEQSGIISKLRLQVQFEIIPAIYEERVIHLKTKDKFVKKCVQKAVHYIADFVYTDNGTGKEVVVDAKGYRTKDYILKKKDDAGILRHQDRRGLNPC